MAATDEELEAYIEVLLMDRAEVMRQDEEAEEEEAEMMMRGSGGETKTTYVPVEESERVARARKNLEAAAADMWKKAEECSSSWTKRRTTPMTEEDLAAAAVYRAKAEEARRKGQRTEEDDALAKWQATGDPEAVRVRHEWIEEDMNAMDLAARDPTEDLLDRDAVEAKRFREFWEFVWAGPDSCGSFEDTTLIQPMVYTDEKPPPGTAYPMRTLQVFSVRVAGIKDELHWPLDVFGTVDARDSLDHNRNIIFNCTRDNCQTIHRENPYLTLIGPTRAIVVVDPVHFEVTLKVKGTTESEDRTLCYLSEEYRDSGSGGSYMFKRVNTSKLSTVELRLGDMVNSVEATIGVKLVGAEWPEGFRGVFFANTTSIDAMEIDLLAVQDDNLPVAADGMIQLSRRVVSVEADG